MKYCKLENNVVIQVQPNKADWFVECPDNIHCGLVWNGVDYEQPVIVITSEYKIKQVYEIVANKSKNLANPLDNLRMTVITGLQGDRARGKPLDAGRQKVLDDAESDPRKSSAEALLIAADDIIAIIDTIDDIDQAFIDRGIT